MKEWFEKFLNDTEERYEAEGKYVTDHPVIGGTFFYLKWFSIGFTIAVFLNAIFGSNNEEEA